MKVVVTGGAGFIGSHYVRSLCTGLYPAWADAQVVVLDALTYAGHRENLASVEGRFTWAVGDIVDRDHVNDVLTGADVVVHFAAESHVDRSIHGADVFVRTNVLGTQTLLDAARAHGVNRFVHVSTDEVYGSIPEGSWPETHPLEPNSPYAASKASSDLFVRAAHRTHKLDTVITRCSNNYGHYQTPEKVIPLFVSNLLDGSTVPLYGEGLNVRDWLHVDDHCRGIQLVAEGGRSGEVYNIGGGTELTNRELTQRLLDALGADWETSVVQVEDRLGHDLRYSVDITKISEELGYRPQVDFTEGLKATVEWYRDNRDWWEPLKASLTPAR